MSNRHQRTLKAVFHNPVSPTIKWRDVERMLVHFGAEIEEHSGSAITIRLNGFTAWFHRPHPQKEAPREMIRTARELLTTAGVAP